MEKFGELELLQCFQNKCVLKPALSAWFLVLNREQMWTNMKCLIIECRLQFNPAIIDKENENIFLQAEPARSVVNGCAVTYAINLIFN